MGKKDPAFLFYTSDFLTGTMFMTDAEVGKYVRLLCAQHQQGGLIKKTVFSSIVQNSQLIREKFIETEDGFFNQRLMEEMEKRIIKSSNLSANAMQRWQRVKQMQCKCNANAMQPEIENKDEIKDKDKIELLVNEYYKYQKTSFSNLIKIDDKLINNSIETIDKIIRLDGFNLDEIKKVLAYIAKDDFWQKQVLSLVSLRNKGKNGNTKFVNAKISSETHISKSEKNKRVLEQWGRERQG